jgi:hypothetical protein
MAFMILVSVAQARLWLGLRGLWPTGMLSRALSSEPRLGSAWLGPGQGLYNIEMVIDIYMYL